MAQKKFDYEVLVEKALRGVIAESLSFVAKNGLQGDQHFYISFLTQFPGVEIPSYLYDEYPEEMTVVLQNQFFGLKVLQNHFEVMLIFKSVPERIIVPFEAITDFMDPSQRFCLKFLPQIVEEEKVQQVSKASKSKTTKAKTAVKEEKTKDKASSATKEDDVNSNVVTLDAFRKK